MLRSILLALAALAAALPLPARGDAWFQIGILTGASALDGSGQNDFPPESDTGIVPVVAVPASLVNEQTASASAGGSSGNGFGSGRAELSAPGSFAGAVLRAVASGQAIAPHGGENATSGYGFGRSGVRYADILHASGAPPGTPIRFRVRIELEGAMVRVGSDSANHVQLTFQDPVLDQLICTNVHGPCSLSDTKEIETIVGGPYGIGLELFTTVTAPAYLLGPAFANASGEFADIGELPPHRARLCIDVITPGTSYTLDSGGDLRCSPDPSPVQVPALPPLALGALALALAAATPRQAFRR